MAMYLDMLDFPVEMPDIPQRIISLVPSISMLLADMNLGHRLVGVTKFCVHPKELRETRQIIGGTKILRFDAINALKPDLIIANKEENNKADIERLQATYPVWVSDIQTIDDALNLVHILGEMTSCVSASQKIHTSITEKRQHFKQTIAPSSARIAYTIWNNPFMAAGGNTFIQTMLNEGGWVNAFAEHTRYPAFTLEGLKAMNVDYLFLASEPFPFGQKHKALFTSVIPEDKIHIIDGEMFSWYGSRLKDSYSYFIELHDKLN